MLGVALALAASCSWGISDFLGGLQSRRFSALSVLLVSQPIGAALAFAVALAFGDRGLPVEDVALAVGGGIAVLVALGSFYRAMALGSISVVAMIAALGVLVPAIGGIVQGEHPEALQGVGAAVAIGGILLVVREPDPEWRTVSRASVGLASVAALGFGTFLLAIDGPADHDAAWTIAAARAGGLAALAATVAYARPRLPRAGGPVLGALVAIGFFDVAANSLYAVATNHGLLPLVAVAGSLYPVVTVGLAGTVLGERLASAQRGGVALALVGVAVIAAGA